VASPAAFYQHQMAYFSTIAAQQPEEMTAYEGGRQQAFAMNN